VAGPPSTRPSPIAGATVVGEGTVSRDRDHPTSPVLHSGTVPKRTCEPISASWSASQDGRNSRSIW